MSLTDLKRKKQKTERPKLSVDDFIEDADNYAFGKPSVLDPNEAKSPAKQKKGLDKASSKSYRHATFTLTENSISQLDALSKQTKMAKSKLLRILIDEFSQKSKSEQKQLLDQEEQDSSADSEDE
jgi:hypothetical protein